MKQQKMMYYIGYGINILFCKIIPIIIIIFSRMIPNMDKPVLDFLVYGYIWPIFLYCICFTFSIIMHELGHLIMGLKNQMIFKEFSFHIFSIYKENEKIKCKVKGLLKETGGFCLMDFPDNLDISNYKNFSIGGIIANIILTFIGIILLSISQNKTLDLISLYLIFLNIGNAVSNIIPFELKNGFNSDGMKLYKMKKDKTYINSINKINELNKLLKGGVALDKIPEELIYKPKEINSSLDINAMNVYISKLIYLGKYNEAEELSNYCITRNNLTDNDINRFKTNLLDIYIQTNRFDLLINIYDKKMYNMFLAFSKFNALFEIYLLLYYLINNDEKSVDKSNQKIIDYFNKNNIDTYENKESLKNYNLIREHYKI